MSRPKRSRPVWDDSRVPQLMSDLLSRGSATIAGIILLVITTVSLMRTVVIPRALRSALSDGVSKVVIWIAVGVSRVRSNYRYRDSVLAAVGPTVIILQLLTWLILYLVAYGLLIYGVSGGQALGESMRQSGSSLLTLGFASADRSNQTVIDFMAAATGPIVIALLIGFLPTIYSAYLERELEVTLLGATGGEPAWGPEILARHAVADNLEACDRSFHDWALWATRLRLTHVTYPVLVWVRSARASRHYLTSLIAVVDAAALQLSLNRSLPQHEAYAVLLQGSQAMEAIYVFQFRRRKWRASMRLADRRLPDNEPHVQQLPVRSQQVLATQLAAYIDSSHELDHAAVDALTQGEARPLTLTREEFDSAVDMLRRAGFPIENDLDDAWAQFSVYRSRYEFAGLAIAKTLDATPAPWTGERSVVTPVMWPTLVVDVLPPSTHDGTPPAPDDA
jgi:hypothetical protein